MSKLKFGNKFYEWYRHGGKVHRKMKKKMFGSRVSHCKLRRMLQDTIPQDPIITMYERREFIPHGAFCPKCGCKGYVGSGNRTSYPEHWEYFYCIKCRNIVGYIDNSPFIHALECSKHNYNPVFKPPARVQINNV